MASYFGEIIEPSTRAIFDEFSDDEETLHDTQFQLSWVVAVEKVPSVLDVIIVIHGRLSLAFGEAYLLDENFEPSAFVDITENEHKIDRYEEDHPIKPLPSKIFIEKKKAICLVSPSYPSDLGYEFTETISPLLKISKKIIVITNDNIYNYKTPFMNELPAAFIRELKTSHNSSKDVAQKLPTPNFISGIPAAVISWCQIFEKNGSAFICYSDQQKLDSITASPYLSVFKKLNYYVIKNENPDFNKKSFYGKPEIIGGSSNIYI